MLNEKLMEVAKTRITVRRDKIMIRYIDPIASKEEIARTVAKEGGMEDQDVEV